MNFHRHHLCVWNPVLAGLLCQDPPLRIRRRPLLDWAMVAALPCSGRGQPLRIHVQRIVKGKKEWWNSLICWWPCCVAIVPIIWTSKCGLILFKHFSNTSTGPCFPAGFMSAAYRFSASEPRRPLCCRSAAVVVMLGATPLAPHLEGFPQSRLAADGVYHCGHAGNMIGILGCHGHRPADNLWHRQVLFRRAAAPPLLTIGR